MMAPDRKTVSRLAAVCARLGSDFDGERAAAGLLATRILADAGISWSDLITRAFAEPMPIHAPPPPSYQSNSASKPAWPGRHFDPVPDEMITLALYRELLATVKLNDWEFGFLSKLLANEVTSLSDKQKMSLSWIIRKRDQAAERARATEAA